MLILLDNGSRRAAATLNLRSLAHHLGERIGTEVHPVSAQHSSKIPTQELDGEPAWTLEPFLRAKVQGGTRDFGIVPLFFGPSRAIGNFVPEVADRVAAELGAFDVHVADPLCPLPAGEPRLAEILADNVRAAGQQPEPQAPTDVVLVDHGSPVPAVTAVRRWLAEQLGERLGAGWRVSEAVMERREGAEYDFNGRLLAEVLDDLGSAPKTTAPTAPVLAMQFISPGRHAGTGGDIAEILAAASATHPHLKPQMSRLIGEHPMFIDILAERAAGLT